MDQVSLFVAGGVGHHFGAFIQNTYDGAGTDYDGSGRQAGDNNTLRVFTWIYY